MKILFLTRYGQQGASSRMRSFQYLPWLDLASIEYTVSPLLDDAMLLHKYQHGNYNLFDLLATYWWRIYALISSRHRFDLIWIEKEALPWFPIWFEKRLLSGVPYVLDFDDALFHNYDLHRASWVRRIFGRRIDDLMANAHLVVAGNSYLAARAIAAGAKWVEIIPTVVDLVRYTPKKNYRANIKPIIVWIGSPSSTRYLLDLTEALRELAKRQSFILRVIGGAATIIISGVDIESLPWSAETEAGLIAESDIGIMPLRDTPWEQGKCAYKLIQYMVCGLPTVASPIGANCNVVIENKTGFFANTTSAWVEKLELLLSDTTLRQRLGETGRLRVEAQYALEQVAPRLVRLLIEGNNR